jgi:hypothetical protein
MATVETALGPVGALPPPGATPAGSAVAVCIRPERLAVLRDGDAPNGYDTVLAAEIDLVEHLGADRRIWLRLDSGARFHADIKNLGDAPPARKARVRVGFRAGDVIALPTPGGTN